MGVGLCSADVGRGVRSLGVVGLSYQGENGNAGDGYGTVLYAERPRQPHMGSWGYGGVKHTQLSE